ncbi:type II toxin-antitoxin system PemK/MazF family toxin [Gordonia sp. ABSL1-1]|uniref:type II toxin-antitoxin system PemK/MazF family toxin n=1 Tax=Gordonia sp. ABSL1-1 TaxID=3053923 RepID=UPI002572D5C4|nr:type II toxin-antitoxin system PemK/MazF family toxin [Gordonia sp. ABSL1-1]MDL9935535.1 type II toxin-antitoxin system PemK/MazF family toxin [Gordonia sp. ABSL1-1]
MRRPPPGRPTNDLARHIEYSPDLDGNADPGEIVWTWVEFEDDPTQGKDRPVLVVGRDRAADDPDTVLGLMLSSKDYHRDDPDWVPIGAGAWDAEHRESFVRLDRILELNDDGIRREGAVMGRAQFDSVAAQLRTRFGWK